MPKKKSSSAARSPQQKAAATRKANKRAALLAQAKRAAAAAQGWRTRRANERAAERERERPRRQPSAAPRSKKKPVRRDRAERAPREPRKLRLGFPGATPDMEQAFMFDAYNDVKDNRGGFRDTINENFGALAGDKVTLRFYVKAFDPNDPDAPAKFRTFDRRVTMGKDAAGSVLASMSSIIRAINEHEYDDDGNIDSDSDSDLYGQAIVFGSVSAIY